MATLQDFYPWVRLDCPGAPYPLLDEAIRRGAREFCKLSHALLADVVVAEVPAQSDYTLTLPTDTEIVAVEFLRESPTVVLAKCPLEQIEFSPPATGTPAWFALVETNPLTLRVYPTPATARTLTARFALMPTLAADTVDDKVLHWYSEGVTAYAKHYLMSQPAKPWSNAEQAAFEYRRFETQLGSARIRRDQSRAGLSNSVAMRPLV